MAPRMRGTGTLAMFYSERLPKAIASPSRARRVLDRLEGQMDDTALANARLLVSELVANAVEHVPGDGEIGLEVTLAVGVLRVEVHDSGGGFAPAPPPPPGSADDAGWGLHLVELLADRWGTEAVGGHRVWFEISA
jgi:anti-sigma regulatory factor (Ser/Thr protein kinase)